ncbi:hypothetical protein COEREDRAFT_80842 [Coemansia reversa NRRL 1564]|uniref:mRNA stability protein n=1 Tax=Coemansia reversa (strain ATCC 12441 / NRRL 1564) TaxID=763665 RepID=A0A2G5BDR7_COERN|nr:hypothetical protein COEREDRAFT_80842 [Coemansia reversa NRRL 1564]|eukprot:PIA17153.1 hypothetical protein COEREDRAFT_80842 [Coemansia reversa NRRL 1564]
MEPAKQSKPVNQPNSEEALQKKYGGVLPRKLPTRIQRERKYFDSGDYALSKAGKKGDVEVGVKHPLPDNIPHPKTSEAGAIPQFVSVATTTQSTAVSSSTTDKQLSAGVGELRAQPLVSTVPVKQNVPQNPLLRQNQPRRSAPGGNMLINPNVGSSRLGNGPTSPLAQARRPIHSLAQESNIPDTSSNAASDDENPSKSNAI